MQNAYIVTGAAFSAVALERRVGVLMLWQYQSRTKKLIYGFIVWKCLRYFGVEQYDV